MYIYGRIDFFNSKVQIMDAPITSPTSAKMCVRKEKWKGCNAHSYTRYAVKLWWKSIKTYFPHYEGYSHIANFWYYVHVHSHTYIYVCVHIYTYIPNLLAIAVLPSFYT